MLRIRHWLLLVLLACVAGCSNEAELTPEEQEQAENPTLTEEQVEAERAIK